MVRSFQGCLFSEQELWQNRIAWGLKSFCELEGRGEVLCLDRRAFSGVSAVVITASTARNML